jgi:hypothetical protein
MRRRRQYFTARIRSKNTSVFLNYYGKGDMVMSQKKVDNYKKSKANRSKEQKKELFYDWLEKVVGVLVCVALVAWIGYSVYDKVEEKKASVVTETSVDVSALENYLSELDADTVE